MYSLDVNFLNDRKDRPTIATPRGGGGGPTDSRSLYMGIGVAAVFVATALGGWGFLLQQNSALEQKQADLNNQLMALQAQLGAVENLNQQVIDIEAQNQALATVFDRIKPWSGLLQDIRDRVPNGVQIDKVEQVAEPVGAAAAPVPTPSPSPAASPSPGASPEASPSPAAGQPPPVATTPQPVIKLRVSGQARTFSEVNDFVLTLQRSPFLNNATVRLVSSQLVNNPTRIDYVGRQQVQANLQVELPKVVTYTIESELTDLPASALLQDLERTLSVGLASRIQALRDRGVIKP
jgi:type IV pilus assembly protein PilN